MNRLPVSPFSPFLKNDIERAQRATGSRANGRWLALYVLSFAFPLTLSRFVFAANLTVDGSQTQQTIDGLGVNAEVSSWKNGQLKPALDALVDTAGASLFRVVQNPFNLEPTNQTAALQNMDMSVYQQLFDAPNVADGWSVVNYLNLKGVPASGIMFNMQGGIPTWMGGAGDDATGSNFVTAGREADYAEMVAAWVYYGRVVKGARFAYVSPQNEPGLLTQGPDLQPTQETLVLHDLAQRLQAKGVGAVGLIAPDSIDAPDSWASEMLADPVVAAQLSHIGFHAYGGSASPGSFTSQKTYWLDETSEWCSTCDSGVGVSASGEWTFAKATVDYLLQDLNNGLPGICIWMGYDAVDTTVNNWGIWGLLAYDQATGIYTPRKRLYAYAQLFKFIRPGMKFVGETDSLNAHGVAAFADTAKGWVTIVGHTNSAAAISGQLKNLPSLGALTLYTTNTSVNLQNNGPVAVAAGAFTVSIPADTIFTLSNVNLVPDATPPVGPTNLILTPQSYQINAAWTAATDNIAVAGYKITVALQSSPSTPLAAYNNKDIGNVTSFSAAGLQPSTPYAVKVVAYDANGNLSTGATLNATTLGPSAPTAPAGLAAAALNQEIDLSWNANVEPDVAGYLVYRAPAAGGPFAALTPAPVSAIFYKDAGLTNGTHYYYRVTAKNTSGMEGSPSLADAIPSAVGPIGPSGTGYRWFGLATPTDNTNKTAEPQVNDGLATDFSLTPGSQDDAISAYEAAGVVWSGAQTVTQVVFTNGAYNAGSQDGVFDAGFQLQFSTDGTAWSNAAGWTVSPSYGYNTSASGGVAYTWSGPATVAKGVRCAGQVRTSETGTNSWYDVAREVQVLGTSGGAGGNACDLNGDKTTNVADVQVCVNQALGVVPCTNADLQGNGQCNAIDVQRVVNSALGQTCVVGP